MKVTATSVIYRGRSPKTAGRCQIKKMATFTRCPTPVTAVLTGLMTVGFGDVTGLRADSCGPPPPVRVEAVCGQTLWLQGWRDRGAEPDTFAEIVSNMSLQLLDSDRRVVAETTAGKDGKFTFRAVRKGRYDLFAEDHKAGFHFVWPIEVTRTRQACSSPLYFFVRLPGRSCGGGVTLKRPVEIKPPREWK